MINGYDDFDVGDNVNDDVLIRRRPVQFSVTSSSAGQLKSPQTFFVCRSVAPSHFRSSSSLIRLYFQCICIAMFPCICIWFLLYLCFIILYLLIRTFLLPMLFLILPLKILPLQSWTSPGKDEEQSFVSLLFIFASPLCIIPLINMATMWRASLRPIRPYSERFFQMPKTGLDFLLNSWKLPPILKRQPFVWCLCENRTNL